MSEEARDDVLDVASLTADIVSAYISNNPVPAGEMPDLISAVNGAIRNLQAPPERSEPLIPPVPVKKSITPDHLISLEDGKPYKMLKSHLSRFGLTPDEYRAKWGLRHDYPMVAPNYAKVRSKMAKSIGLGGNIAASKSVAEPKRGTSRPNKAL